MPTTKTPKKKDARKAPTKAKRVRAMTRTEQRFNSHANWLQELERRVQLLEKSNSLLQELDAKKEEQGKWVPENGGYVVRLADEVPTVGEIQYTVPNVGQVSVKWPSGICVHFARQLRTATQAEIDAHLESSAYGEREGLEEGDACDCDGSDVDHMRELLGYEQSAPAQYHIVMWICGELRRYGSISAAVNVIGDGKINWLPFPVFKKLLIKTIEKLKAAREEEEAKKPLEPWTRVKWENKEDCRILEKSPGHGNYYLIWRPGCMKPWDAARHELTVLNN